MDTALKPAGEQAAAHTDALRDRIARLVEEGFREVRAAMHEDGVCSFGRLAMCSPNPGFLRGNIT